MSDAVRVLVTEDDEVIREVLVLALMDEGYEVQSASNGIIALEISARWRPHLILLDMMMPEMDGWTLLERLRDQSELASIPAVVISANRRIKGQAETLGVEAVIQKPFDLAEVVKIARAALKRSFSTPS